ncbi:MAG: glycosyltransferase family 2 protein [Chitinophagaceae bacterium]
MNPKITIVTVVRNALNTIEQTMLSILYQTYSNIEYIIVDGASTDGTKEIIKNYELRIMNGEFPNIVSFKFISEPDKGIYDAMNKGIDMATGEWVNFMNAGDSFYENDVIRYIFLDKKLKNYDVVYGDTNWVYSKKRFITKPTKPIQKIKKMMVFGHPSSFTKSALLKKEKFDTTYKSSADYKFFYEAYIDQKLFFYIHITIANFEAETGISSINNALVWQENNRLKGNKLHKFRIIQFNFYRFFVNVLKRTLPFSWYHKLRNIWEIIIFNH